jgi:O-succinylbenzoic acid--CoA ligase
MMMLVRSIECGLNLYCIKPSTTPLALLDSDSNFDFAAFTPMQFYAITDKTCFEKAQRISKIILGGEDISSALLNLIQQLSSSVYATFGMTETISHIALKKLNGNKPDKHYKTLSGIEINADEVGRLRIHAPSLLPTDLLTNDEVRIISKHEFDWLGRTDNVINSGGIKIHPEIAEQKLHAFIPYNFFIAGEENSITGKSVALVIEKESLNDIELGGIKESLFRLEKHERPRAILLSSPFIKTENGKLNRTKTIKNVSKRMEL